MADLNSWSVTGRLTKDAEYRVLAGGKALLSCGIAVNTGWGEHRKTTFAKVNQWGERGANLCKYLTKGRLIAVTGTLTTSAWVGRDGKEHTELVIDTTGIQLLGGDGPRGAEGDEPKQPAVPSESKAEYLDEVPF